MSEIKTLKAKIKELDDKLLPWKIQIENHENAIKHLREKIEALENVDQTKRQELEDKIRDLKRAKFLQKACDYVKKNPDKRVVIPTDEDEDVLDFFEKNGIKCKSMYMKFDVVTDGRISCLRDFPDNCTLPWICDVLSGRCRTNIQEEGMDFTFFNRSMKWLANQLKSFEYTEPDDGEGWGGKVVIECDSAHVTIPQIEGDVKDGFYGEATWTICVFVLSFNV